MTDARPNIDEIVERNAAYASESHDAQAGKVPLRNLAVVTCMDARMDPLALLGLDVGEAHIIRNAGGVITDDVIRSLCLSQRYLETREIVLIHHTDCGLQNLDETEFRADMVSAVGEAPTWSLQSFADPYEDVRASIARIEVSPFIEHGGRVSGFVFDVSDGLLHPA